MKVLFCGGGAIGSFALLVGRDLKAHLAVIDFDRVEAKNLASQWFVKPMVGKNKATALKMQMLNFYGVTIKDYTVKLTDLNAATILPGHDLIVDGFDNGESRGLLQRFVREHNLPCIHAGLAADGAFGAVRWDRAFTIDSEDTPGQPTCEGAGFLPLIVTLSASLVTSIRLYGETGRELNWNVTPQGASAFA